MHGNHAFDATRQIRQGAGKWPLPARDRRNSGRSGSRSRKWAAILQRPEFVRANPTMFCKSEERREERAGRVSRDLGSGVCARRHSRSRGHEVKRGLPCLPRGSMEGLERCVGRHNWMIGRGDVTANAAVHACRVGWPLGVKGFMGGEIGIDACSRWGQSVGSGYGRRASWVPCANANIDWSILTDGWSDTSFGGEGWCENPKRQRVTRCCRKKGDEHR